MGYCVNTGLEHKNGLHVTTWVLMKKCFTMWKKGYYINVGDYDISAN